MNFIQAMLHSRHKGVHVRRQEWDPKRSVTVVFYAVGDYVWQCGPKEVLFEDSPLRTMAVYTPCLDDIISDDWEEVHS